MIATAATESQIRALIDAVDRADEAGNRGEAERALAQARAAAPDHPGVLNVAGMRALLAGNASAARPLLERAVALDPASPMLWLNLALAHRELNDQAAERDAIEQALTADPRFFPALLHKARLFERQGKLKLAAYMYHAFLCCVPAGVQQPPAVRSAMEHANKLLKDNDAALEAFLQPRLDEARARHVGARLERFDACFEALIGKRLRVRVQLRRDLHRIAVGAVLRVLGADHAVRPLEDLVAVVLRDADQLGDDDER